MTVRTILERLAIWGALALPTAAVATERVTFGLNWVPEAEQCGFFQAQARGLYRQAGLDVELRPGNPNVNLPLLVAAGELDMGMGSSFTVLNLAARGVKAKLVAAMFQKDEQTLVAHAGQGIRTLSDLKDRPIMVGQLGRSEFWQFLKARYGFRDDQLRPYTYSAVPFMADPGAVQQGYITDDGYVLGRQLRQPPVSLLLADYGYDNYATGIFATDAYIEAHPAAVQAFVDATIRGYGECLHGDATPAMAAILAAAPEGGTALFDFKLSVMRDRGLVDGGDAARLGIGAMTDERWKRLFETMSQAGIYPKDLDYRSAYTLKFVDAKRPAHAAR